MNVGGSVSNISISKAAFSEMTPYVSKLELDAESETFVNTGKTALLLFATAINEATSIAEGCGGSDQLTFVGLGSMKMNWNGHAGAPIWPMKW